MRASYNICTIRVRAKLPRVRFAGGRAGGLPGRRAGRSRLLNALHLIAVRVRLSLLLLWARCRCKKRKIIYGVRRSTEKGKWSKAEFLFSNRHYYSVNLTLLSKSLFKFSGLDSTLDVERDSRGYNRNAFKYNSVILQSGRTTSMYSLLFVVQRLLTIYFKSFHLFLINICRWFSVKCEYKQNRTLKTQSTININTCFMAYSQIEN